MNEYLPYLIFGLTAGSIYGISAMGLVLTYKTSGVFNFAHGAVSAVGAYVFYECCQERGLPWPVAFVHRGVHLRSARRPDPGAMAAQLAQGHGRQQDRGHRRPAGLHPGLGRHLLRPELHVHLRHLHADRGRVHPLRGQP